MRETTRPNWLAGFQRINSISCWSILLHWHTREDVLSIFWIWDQAISISTTSVMAKQSGSFHMKGDVHLCRKFAPISKNIWTFNLPFPFSQVCHFASFHASWAWRKLVILWWWVTCCLRQLRMPWMWILIKAWQSVLPRIRRRSYGIWRFMAFFLQKSRNWNWTRIWRMWMNVVFDSPIESMGNAIFTYIDPIQINQI